MTLRLRCIRCGDMAEMDASNNWDAGLCAACVVTGLALLRAPGPAFTRWLDRWQRGWNRHPTYKALVAALDNLPEPGKFDAGSISTGEPDAEDDVLCFVEARP